MSISVNFTTLSRAYNRGEGPYQGGLFVLGENLTGFVVEDSFFTTCYDVDSRCRKSIQYGLPKDLFFDVLSLQQIPRIADFRIHCPELDEVFGFVDEHIVATYLFGYQTQFTKPDKNTNQTCGFQISDPENAANILITVSAVNGGRPNYVQKLMSDVCLTSIGGRISFGNYEAYGISEFHLPYLFQNTPGAGGQAEDEAFAAETERRLRELRADCQRRWDDHLNYLKKRVIKPIEVVETPDTPETV